MPVVTAMLLLGATFQGERGVVGTVTFTATIEPNATLSVEDHDVGNGVVSYVATYRENHSMTCDAGRIACRPNGKGETLEVLAMRGDSIDFTAGERLAARRYRHDGWPKSDEALARLASR